MRDSIIPQYSTGCSFLYGLSMRGIYFTRVKLHIFLMIYLYFKQYYSLTFCGQQETFLTYSDLLYMIHATLLSARLMFEHRVM